MKFNRGYKYRLKVSKEQKQLLFNHIFTYNQTWNILLNLKEKEYQSNLLIPNKPDRKYINSTEQDNIVKKILKNRELKFNTKVTQQCRMIFNKDFQKTIKALGTNNIGMLKFKSSKNFNGQGFQTTKEQYKILDNNDKYKILRLFNQSFYIRWTRDFPSKSEIKNITITYDNNHFYISFNVIIDIKKKDVKLSNILPGTRLKSYGMDINLNTIDIGNHKIHKQFDIKHIKDDNLKKKYKEKLDYLQRKQSKRIETSKKHKTKLSKNFKKTQDKINKIFKKNTNKKIFHLHELVNTIIKNLKDNKVNHLVIEDLNIKNMTKKTTQNNKIQKIGKKNTKEMKKNILQISLGLFVEILKYKCCSNEIYLELVNPELTSKTCNHCGNIKSNMDVTIREYNCSECSYTNDRDYNSVLNILDKSKYTKNKKKIVK